MSTVHNINQKLDIIRQNIEPLPFKCKFFLYQLLNYFPHINNFQPSKDFKISESPFIHTFRKLNDEEKIYFLSQISSHISVCLKNQIKISDVVNSIETPCQIKTAKLGITHWQKRNLKFDYKINHIRLFTSKKEDLLDLRKYLMRKSTSQRNSIVFESISKQISDKHSKITLRFINSFIFEEIHNGIRKIIIEISQKMIEDLLKEGVVTLAPISTYSLKNKDMTILTTQRMKEFFIKKKKITEQLNRNKIKSRIIFYQESIKIFRSEESKKHFYFQKSIISPKSMKDIKQSIPFLSYLSKKQKFTSEIVETSNINITADYLKLNVGLKQYEWVAMSERNETQAFCNILMKTVIHLFQNISIEFISASLKNISKNQYLIQLNLILDTPSKKTFINNKDVISLMLEMLGCEQDYEKRSISKDMRVDQLNYSNYPSNNFSKAEENQLDQSLQLNIGNQFDQRMTNSSVRKSSSKQSEENNYNSDQDECYFTIVGENDGEKDLQEFDSFQDENNSIENDQIKVNKNQLNTQLITLQNGIDLPIVNPLKILKKHFLFEDWKKSAKGGVVCINQDVIKEQKRIVRLIISKIGSNVFKGNNIMNFSLPVQLFKNESSLISIGRNISYAPLLIEPSVHLSPVQRLKKGVVFSISMVALALSTKKPFNPLLGETYQGKIGDCPLFMEQISHHPPITSLYFIGKGYKIYGTMCVEISLRMNHVKGVNISLMTIQFDNGDKIEFQMPVMLINGLIFGERSIYYQGTIYITDSKNNLITQLIYNSASKKGMFNFKSQSPDQFTGEIFQVTPSFMEKFISSKRKLSLTKNEGNKVVAQISGQWNGKVFINNQQIFNFQEDLPVQLENISRPLPSDSVFRTDVIELTNNNIETSQQQKDKLQQIQRNDKKLRVTHKSSKNRQ